MVISHAKIKPNCNAHPGSLAEPRGLVEVYFQGACVDLLEAELSRLEKPDGLDFDVGDVVCLRVEDSS